MNERDQRKIFEYNVKDFRDETEQIIEENFSQLFSGLFNNNGEITPYKNLPPRIKHKV